MKKLQKVKSNFSQSFLGILRSIDSRLKSSLTLNGIKSAHVLKGLWLTLENYRREQRSAYWLDCQTFHYL